VRQAVNDDGMKAGIRGDNLERRARGRIALEHDGNVFPELTE
jgi:hypothetical protein